MQRSPASIPQHDGQSGSMVIGVVLLVTLIGGLAGVMTQTIPTSQFQMVDAAQKKQAYYSAEAGLRYVQSAYLNQGDTDEDGSRDDDRAQLMVALHNQDFVMPGGSGDFSLDIRPYWMVTRSVHVADTTLRVRFPGAMPTAMAIPGSGRLSIGGVTHTYTARTISGEQVNFTLAGGVNTTDFDSVYFVETVGALSGGDLRLSGTASTHLPADGGMVRINGNAHTYDHLEVDGSDVWLRDVSGSPSASAGDDVVFQKALEVNVAGGAGGGTLDVLRNLNVLLAFTDDEGAEVLEEMDDSFNPPEETFMNLDNWVASDSGAVKIAARVSHSGQHNNYLVLHDIPQMNDCQSGEQIKFAEIRYNMGSYFSNAWSHNNSKLSYEVQIKMAEDLYCLYMASGLGLRHHQKPGVTGNYNHDFIGVSFIKYYGGLQSLNASEWSTYNSRRGWPHRAHRPDPYNDYIPDAICPPGYSTMPKWFEWTQTFFSSWTSYRNPQYEDDKILLVVWAQKYDADAGCVKRRWLAYKQVNKTYEDWIKGRQWWGDGRTLNDNATLLVRLAEKGESGNYYNELSCYWGDANRNHTSRSPNTDPVDINAYRHIYKHSADYAASDQKFPSWPALVLADWSAQTNDYFTFLASNGSGVRNGDRWWVLTWDGVNTAPDPSGLFDVPRLLSDGGTLRLTDDEFITPKATEGEVYPTNRAEIAYHSYGRVWQDNWACGGDDFAPRFLKNAPGDTGSVLLSSQK